jgi:acetaldehyde dehydrogenase/alcohol dehydrogenase
VTAPAAADMAIAAGTDQRLDETVQRAQDAARALRRLDQEAVDRIVWAMVVAGLENAIDLAELAMEETGFGVLEDKVIKNYIATEFLFDYLRASWTRSKGIERCVRLRTPLSIWISSAPTRNSKRRQ